jgi:hypothetical protein
MAFRKDLTGWQLGWLTVVRETGRRSRAGDVFWLVRCRCGVELEQYTSALLKKPKREGQAPRSCGCYCKTTRSPLYKGIGDLSKCFWLRVLSSAKRKGLVVALTIDDAWRLFVEQGRRCALTGLPIVLSPSSLAAGANTASLDRIDSAKGYIPGNVQWVHVVMQDMKSNFPQAEFIEWCRLVTDHTRR